MKGPFDDIVDGPLCSPRLTEIERLLSNIAAHVHRAALALHSDKSTDHMMIGYRMGIILGDAEHAGKLIRAEQAEAEAERRRYPRDPRAN